MEKKKQFIIPLVIINFILTIIIFCYLILIGPYQRYNINYDNDDKTDIIGSVTRLDENKKNTYILVESTNKNSVYDKAYVTINDRTIIKSLFKSTKIQIGDLVEIKFKGPVKESYPVQATAKTVWIKDRNVK